MKYLKRLSLFSVLGCLVFLNQNCGELESYDLGASHSASLLDQQEALSSAPRLGDRVFVASVFAEAFLPSGNPIAEASAATLAGSEARAIFDYVTSEFIASEDDEVVEIILEKVLQRGEEFYGTCLMIEGDESCFQRNQDTRHTTIGSLNAVSPPTVIREGSRLSACEALIASDQAMRNLIANLTGSRDSVLDLINNVEDVFDLFYPDQPISSEALTNLVSAAQAVLLNSDPEDMILEPWRAVVLPVCQSAGWQVP